MWHSREGLLEEIEVGRDELRSGCNVKRRV